MKKADLQIIMYFVIVMCAVVFTGTQDYEAEQVPRIRLSAE